MDFTSHVYGTFLIVVLAGWQILPLAWGYRLLLAASYVFYGWWSPDFLVFIVLSTAVDYYAALGMHGATIRRRNALVGLSLVTNLGLLATLKYTPLALVTAADLSLVTSGTADEFRALASVWIVPVGVSFYTFQSLSYTVDVYRGRLEPTRSLEQFALFVAFFPQLVAGPIVRATTFFGQIRDDPRGRVDPETWARGWLEIVAGLFLKTQVADHVAADVDRVFDADDLLALSPSEVRSAVVLFAGQIFADFAGYSWIAIGSARLLGFSFPENFRAPYIATSLSDFWRRWHISLSTWLRDYLYIPLGGSRHGVYRTYAALLVTMLLGGLWHGAAWNFVIWGLIHGCALAVERPLIRRDRPDRRLRSLLGWAWTLSVVLVAWIFFRASTLSGALTLLQQALEGPYSAKELIEWGPLIPVVIVHFTAVRPLSRGWLAFAFGAMLAWMAVFSRSAAPRFIYFQF